MRVEDKVHRDGHRLEFHQQAHEQAISEVGGHLIGLWTKNALPTDSRVKRSARAVERHARADLYRARTGPCAVPVHEGPQLPIPTLVEPDTLVIRQVGRNLRPSGSSEISRRRTGKSPDLSQLHGSKPRVGQVCETDCDIDAFVDEIDYPVD